MDGCRREVIAQGPCAEVARCGCGHIHLSVGPVTLRLEEPVLRLLWATLGEALLKLESPVPPKEPSSAPVGWKQ